MKRIGILGGTFDPIHIGHLIAAEQALFYAKLDEIWFIPAPNPPHKMGQNITAINHRVEMVRRAVELDKRYQLCTIELEREGPSYTVDTVRDLREIYQDYSFYLILGGDMIKYLPKWQGIDELLQIVKLIGLERPGYVYDDQNPELTPIISRVQFVPMPQLDISSSQIRNWRRIGRTIRYVLPERVEEYILENGLYDD